MTAASRAIEPHDSAVVANARPRKAVSLLGIALSALLVAGCSVGAAPSPSAPPTAASSSVVAATGSAPASPARTPGPVVVAVPEPLRGDWLADVDGIDGLGPHGSRIQLSFDWDGGRRFWVQPNFGDRVTLQSVPLAAGRPGGLRARTPRVGTLVGPDPESSQRRSITSRECAASGTVRKDGTGHRSSPLMVGSVTTGRRTAEMNMQRDLVLRAQAGDHEAFSNLAAGAISRLHRTARLILRDDDAASDAVQEALTTAWLKIRSVREPDRIDAWLNRLVVRSCFNLAARSRRRGLIELHTGARERSWSGGPEHELAVRDQIDRALRRLTAEQRAVLVVRHYLDLSDAEGAGVLGIPLGTFKSRLNRASSALRAAMEADERVSPRPGEAIA